MKSQAASAATIILTLLLSLATPAFETDQFALSPKPLWDIGPEISAYVSSAIDKAVADVNSQINKSEQCLASPINKGCLSKEKEEKKLTGLRTPASIAKAVYEQLGEGSLFTTKTGKWFEKHKFEREPSRFKPDYSDSIFITRPINYATLSPTVRMFGSEFGFDKIDHFFQQGYKYYTIANEAGADGAKDSDAAAKAIRWGHRTERTYFGSLVSGVYSNGDLFANFAGMKFYRRLTAETFAGGARLEPLLELNHNYWRWRSGVRENEDVLKRFISDQLNEALNPSGMSYFLYRVAKKVVMQKDCPAWRAAFPHSTALEFEKRSSELETWNGEDYGFTKKDHRIQISKCFSTDPAE